MKVTGGLVGITQNASARERFFLTAPELSRLAEEAHVTTGSLQRINTMTCRWLTGQGKKRTFCMYPMTHKSEDLSNIITKVVMPAQIQKDVCSRDDIGQQEYARFVQERINTNEVSVWARMKKVQPKTWKSARKSVKHKLDD